MFAEEYVKLSFRLNKHIPGLVDAYYGPALLKSEVDGEGLVPLPVLSDMCRGLAETVQSSDGDTYLRTYREKQVDALAAQIDRLLGMATDYHSYVHRLFDIDLTPVRESEIDGYHEGIEMLLRRLGYDGEAGKAVQRWEQENEVRGEELAELVRSICLQARKRTRKIVSLPRGENVTIEMVHSQPWSGYNWYQGKYRSLVQVNLDLPRNRFEAEDLSYHEAYPGHHTDHSSKERSAYRQRGLVEASILLINTPCSVMGEGIASVAGRFISDQVPDDARQLYRLLSRTRRACDTNATIRLHAEGASKSAMAEFLEKRGLMTPQRAAKRMEFLTNPLWSSYSFTYWFGTLIVEAAYQEAKATNRTSEFFNLLYNELLTPTILKERMRKLC